jgi:hypothetical protein
MVHPSAAEATHTLKAVSSNGEVSHHETVRNMLLELASKGEHPVAGINGDFFSTVGVPSGLMISNSELVSSSSASKVALAVMADRSVRLEQDVATIAKLTTDIGELYARVCLD